MKQFSLIFVMVCASTLPSLALASCGSAFCTVNSNWTSQSATTEAGSVFDVRYEYINQAQPRSGSDKIAAGQISHHHDEVSTLNGNLLATYSHTFNSEWGVSVVAPLVSRNHVHIHNHRGQQIQDRWDFTEPGDVRIVGRYQLPFLGDPIRPVSAGVTFGLKLPTGKTSIVSVNGDLAERTLQPGSGTTDAIIGGYFHQKLPQWNASWFVQAQFQQALNHRNQFKPGSQFGIDAGIRYGVTDKWGALVQLNALVKRRDSGAQAESDDSGVKYLSISPGLSYAVADTVQIYGFFQKPVYQYVNGVQLTADMALVIGLSSRF